MRVCSRNVCSQRSDHIIKMGTSENVALLHRHVSSFSSSHGASKVVRCLLAAVFLWTRKAARDRR